jgi:hypothetical protein
MGHGTGRVRTCRRRTTPAEEEELFPLHPLPVKYRDTDRVRVRVSGSTVVMAMAMAMAMAIAMGTIASTTITRHRACRDRPIKEHIPSVPVFRVGKRSWGYAGRCVLVCIGSDRMAFRGE